MTEPWSKDELERISTAEELEIAVRRADGTLRRWMPIWAVCVDGQVYVRTWYRRDTGWYGRVVQSRRARIRVRGLERDVSVEDAGHVDSELRAGVDAAYRTKYARYGSTTVAHMTTDEAAASTLRIIPGSTDHLSEELG